MNNTGIIKFRRLSRRIAALLSLVLLLTGCGTSFSDGYETLLGSPLQSMRTAPSFASDLCVSAGDVNAVDITIEDVTACAGLFDVTNAQTLYAKSIYDRIEPASLTKVMTAYVALKYGNLNQVITATANVRITESGAQLIGLEKGDKMTLLQALHLLLIYSANDVALMIAENIAGSVNEFVTMMNNEAMLLGATTSHFANPHGLHADDHYVSVYDMYLIFNAALQYQQFVDIINMESYATTYTSATGAAKEADISSTNQYLTGKVSMPEGSNVIGGKTGTTNAAGHCLIIQARNREGQPYIACVMRAGSLDALYEEMSVLLSKINN